MKDEMSPAVKTAVKSNDVDGLVAMVKAAKLPHELAWEVVDTAIISKNEALVDAMLPFLNAMDTSYPLVRAASRGYTRIVRKLMPFSLSRWNQSLPLKEAAARERTGAVKALLECSDALANKSQPLYEAAFHGHVATVRALIPKSDPKALRSRALRAACFEGHLEVVKALLPVSSSIECALHGFTGAAYYGRLAVVDYLISAGLPDPIDTFAAGLDQAVRAGHLDVVCRLIEALAMTGKPLNFGSRALHQAVQDGRVDLVRVLLDATDESAFPELALSPALEKGYDEIADLLIERVREDCARKSVLRDELLPPLNEALARCNARKQHAHLHHAARTRCSLPSGRVAQSTRL